MAKKKYKTLIGLDIGCDSLKVVVCSGGKLKKGVQVPMPQNLMKAGRAVSPEALGELIRSTLKENGISCREAALVLPNDVVYLRNATMPRMTAEQLLYNLPFEFRDYISDELKNYAFDYAMISTPEELLRKPGKEDGEETEDGPGSMHLLAVAVPFEVIDEYRAALRKAGVKLVALAPTVSAFHELIGRLPNDGENAREDCVLDLGNESIRMYMFKGGRHVVTRVLEIGLQTIDQVIADALSVDAHLAHTYLLTNHENCQNAEYCLNTYGNIAVELMRALNFYRFSNPDSRVNDLWICGGGANIRPLCTAIEEALDLTVHDLSELVGDVEDAGTYAQAVGITMTGD
ncbi:MAG: pilus assembly protein PilM [Oscillospiraceae bacterium]|nr:pilus assembly protein PilM [Oscillospiraceae bacterium]